MTPAELRAAMSALPEPVTELKPPHWEYWKWDLWKRVTDGENPEEFWKWPCVYHPLLNNHWLHLMQFEVETLYDYPVSLFDLLTPPKNGVFDYLPNSMFSATMSHQLYHIRQWEKTTGRLISDLSTIVEFGAGYGALPLLVHRLGFKGTYYIVDLPEFGLLQQYYLSNTGEIDSPVIWQSKTERGMTVEWIKDGFLSKELDGLRPELLIALYSLSETPYSLRDGFLDTFQAKSHLFLYSNRFADYDNVAYFDGYTKRAGGNWKTWVIEHMPSESLYSIGWTE